LPFELAQVSPGKPIDAVALIFSCAFLPLSEFGGNPVFGYTTSPMNPTSSRFTLD
jgi:hypothetical protein